LRNHKRRIRETREGKPGKGFETNKLEVMYSDLKNKNERA